MEHRRVVLMTPDQKQRFFEERDLRAVVDAAYLELKRRVGSFEDPVREQLNERRIAIAEQLRGIL